jgi:hypothetical protein
MSDGNKPHVLLCASLWWPSSARLAMAFVRAGCRVSAICPRGHPILRVSGIAAVYRYSALKPMASLRSNVLAARPDLIVPCDDGALWQLYELSVSDPRLMPLIEHSLGPSRWFETLQSRSRVLEVASKMGIRVPCSRPIHSKEDIHGWPWEWPAVLKIDATWGGEGIFLAHSEEEAARAFEQALSAVKASVNWKRFLVNRYPLALWSWRRRKSASVSLQRYIRGQPATAMIACWHGEILGQVTVEVLSSQNVTGAATVVRLLEHDQITSASRLLAGKFMLTGLHGLDFILEDSSKAAYLIELNPRATQLGHLKVNSNGDLASLISGRLSGSVAPADLSAACIRDDTIALFPSAWNQNPRSPYLSSAYHDVPWEEPELVREFMRPPWPDRRFLNRLLSLLSARRSQSYGPEMKPTANPRAGI